MNHLDHRRVGVDLQRGERPLPLQRCRIAPWRPDARRAQDFVFEAVKPGRDPALGADPSSTLCSSGSSVPASSPRPIGATNAGAGQLDRPAAVARVQGIERARQLAAVRPRTVKVKLGLLTELSCRSSIITPAFASR